jgi:hypothetical protein
MPTAHYIPLSALNENGLHPTHLNRTTETALRLDVEVPRSDPSDNNGGIPRTMDVATNVCTLAESLPNLDSTVNNGQKKKRNMQVRFIDRLEDLKAYKEKHGHLNVSKEDEKSLYHWCNNIKQARRGTGNMNLTADGIVALDAIGFDWRGETSSHKSFQDRVNALSEYKEINGHLNVTIEDNKSLKDWCANIRSARKGKLGLRLTADRIAALDAIGFDWRSETKPRSGQRQISFIHDVKNGHLNVTYIANKSLNDFDSNLPSSALARKRGDSVGESKLSPTIGDVGYVFRKEFVQGWFTGIVVKIMKDGDRRCEYSDGDVEDLLLDDLVQLAKLDPNNSKISH